MSDGVEGFGDNADAVRDTAEYMRKFNEPMRCEMTLRDVFACAIASGLVASPSDLSSMPKAAQWCYAFADAMLRAREAHKP